VLNSSHMRGFGELTAMPVEASALVGGTRRFYVPSPVNLTKLF